MEDPFSFSLLIKERSSLKDMEEAALSLCAISEIVKLKVVSKDFKWRISMKSSLKSFTYTSRKVQS